MKVRAQAAAYSIFRLGTVIILALLGDAPAASAQVPERSYRIGFLGQTSVSAHSAEIAALREGLRDAGYHEGGNLKIEYRWAEGKLDRLPGLAAELARMRVDLIVTHGTAGSRAAKQATAAIPIVIAAVSDPVRIGVVASLARPGANVTGISIQEMEVILKRLDSLRQALPAVSRIVMLRARGLTPADLSIVPTLNAAARAQGLSLDRAEIQGSDDFARVFSVMVQQGAQAIHVENTSVLRAHAAALARLAVKHRLPTVGAPSFVDAGVLIGYGPNLEDMYRRAAGYVDRILKGAKPGDLPVEQPMKFELAVNLKTARSLALNVPREFLIQADRVIE